MEHGIATGSKVLVLGLGALLAPVLLSGVAHADPERRLWMQSEPIPPASPGAVTSELVARGAAGELRIDDAATGVRLHADGPMDVALVRATLAPQSSTPWHEHLGPSMVVVTGGELRLVAPEHGDGHGCDSETFGAGDTFGHPASTHLFANHGTGPAEFYIVYLVPQGESPAPIPVDAPRGC
ncbi:hypothetical protein OF117_01825 [Geodermatophilus sp. YIM 151500]|uniref:hypothetical protein n=1 Tax=Geodermatophilus sp. YIM 151500 TaxID=2984531 RepID=UPI0021E3E589|nr:hypothetical protein [Geodermatophilus sp. YIM 151500]MCV2488089.1 hypothetical protein [Geodermatophilus sp. YIM 151500]